MATYYGKIANPLHEAIAAIIGKPVPEGLEGEDLQNFVTQNANPYWATGDGIIEAAELLVKRAQENANIEGYQP